MKLASASNVFHKKDKAFAIYSGEFCSSFLFDRVFRSVTMTSIRGSSFTFSRSGIPESRFTLFTGELWHFFVSLISFADLLFEEAFIKLMKLSVSILDADSPHILESIREISCDRSMVDLQKIRPVVRYIMRFLTSINPKNQHLNQKMT